MTRLFGTDGIRGVANEDPLTPDLAFRVGRQLVATLLSEHAADRVRLVIGRDTRLSGPLLESALVAGLLSAGAECYAVGVLPTPAIALLTKKLGAHGGIVLSASHNPFEDNGIKLFSSEGTKLPDAWEDEIEQGLQGDDRAPRARGAEIGRLVTHTRAEADYVDFLCRAFPLQLRGLTVVLDCAHGATYRVAPRVFRRLGARVLTIGTRPDGRNINAGGGALHPERLQRAVRARGASVGFAFDGDGDRLISVDHTGAIRDGDYALAIAGRHLAARGRLKGNVIVTTVMANLGLDQALHAAGIRVVKTQVGDRYVSEEMQRLGANLGGEQSGHLLFLDHSPAGDGILSALALLGVAAETGETLASLARCLSKFPQVLRNVAVKAKPPIDALTGLAERVATFEREMNGAGRILIRYSGTEPLARVMVEGADGARVSAMADELAGLIRTQIGE
ncbi:MAG: phosphoglucosamine mutase [Candidatus Rokubacteria bacterium 13_1_20CM_4_70_14]|nr:MAG: phosphoglucosamine mutase [Candidatus Rokubacteria bacterium 13_1_20CM_4_70_14]PYM50235.1 MAG: phosphoglucosamine mutase [Candidatus Rokubacteria bacterium]